MRLPRASQILTRPTFLFCTFALFVLPFLPREGTGLSLCGFYNLAHVPCWGCGMTRALGNITILDFEKAWAYHPFSYLLFPFLVFFGLAGPRKKWSQKISDFLIRHDRGTTFTFWFCLSLFLAYGFWRMFFEDQWLGHDFRFHLKK